MKRVLLALIFCASAAPAGAETAGCGKFREAMTRASGELKADFARPLVVSRGSATGIEQYDLVSRARIDGMLRCRGEAFVSFEATIHLPADAALAGHFAEAQTAALISALGWPQARANAMTLALARDAAEYLRGSAERGDVSVAGKTEEHLAGDVEVGAVWTRTERTFILLNGG